MSSFKPKEVFGFSNLWTIGVSLLIAGIAYGAASERLDGVEEKQEALETRQGEVLEQIRADIAILRVDLAKVSQDIKWLKEREISQK
jgi:hypothetical protein